MNSSSVVTYGTFGSHPVQPPGPPPTPPKFPPSALTPPFEKPPYTGGTVVRPTPYVEIALSTRGILTFCGQYLRAIMPTCKTKPPPGQDIKEYLDRLKDIVQQLNASNNKEIAIERLDLMINAIKAAIRTTNPDITF